ncbi:MAG: hypothetical protein ABI723_12230 [Bacteroidia bacterium]
MKGKSIAVLLLVIILCAVWYVYKSQKPNTVIAAFYYWKSVYKISNEERILLDTLHVKRLYIKYFDVIWNPDLNQPAPEAVLKFSSIPDLSIEFIPVVFIVNDVLKKCNNDNIDSLSIHVSSLLKKINETNKISIKEIQFDCDWSDETKKKYFRLLKKVESQFQVEKILFSATIRLHQIKYYQRTGIPPVQRGMLMFYNMGQLQNPLTKNSIFDEDVAGKYIDFVKAYPMHLDYALPVFTWGVHIRNNKVINLENNISAADMDSIKQIQSIAADKFMVTDGFFFHGEYFLKGDVIRIEEVTPELALKAAKLLSDETNNKNFTVSLFHLDSANTKRYANKDFENIYHSFN